MCVAPDVPRPEVPGAARAPGPAKADVAQPVGRHRRAEERSSRHLRRKLSTYRRWLEECGFTVTQAIARNPADIPADVIPVPGILSAMKTA